MTEQTNESVIRAAKALMEIGVTIRTGEWDDCVSAASIALAASEQPTTK